MAQYILRKIDSNEIVSTFEWDGVEALSAPIGYEFEQLIDSGSQFISYTASLFDSSGIDIVDSIFVGTHRGTFSGDIISATFAGNPIEQLINSTQYGQLTKIRSDNEGYLLASTQSSFQIIDESTILMSGNSLSTEYSRSFSEIFNNNIKNYTLTFRSNEIPPKTIQYIVKNTDFIPIGNYGVYQLDVIGLNENSREFKNKTKESDIWHIDIDFNSFENTGSFTGSFDGDFFIDGEKFDETFKIAPKPCTILKYEEDVINQLPTDGGLNPQGGYFIFDKDTSINGSQYGEDSWRLEKPTRIRLNLQTLGDTVQQNDYEEKLFKIIRERLGESEITLEQILPNSLTAAYKKFQIIRGIYRERSRRKDANREYPVKYHYLDWGSQNFEETDRYFGQEDIDYFAGDGEFGLDFNSIGKDSARDGFFEFEVKQIEPSNINPDIKPEQDAEFRICVRSKEYRREITVFETSGEYTFPEWADQITIYTVGAGGGGGGGAWGYPHKVNPNSLFYGDVVVSLGDTYYDVNYSNTTNIGHEWVVGGGGGAGGSVAIASLSKEKIPYYNRNLIVIVGAPGSGGEGLSYDLPKFASNDLSLYYALNKNSDPNKYGLGYDPDSSNLPIKGRNSSHIVKPESKNFGKKGGDSFVYIKNSNRILVKAQGGSGGNCGLSSHYNVDKIHNGYCRDQGHRMDDDIITSGKPFTLALGGGGSTQESIGDILRSGGHGGYGVATTPFYKPYGDGAKKFLSLDVLISTKNSNMNNAPNIPWFNNSIGYLTTPMGRLNNNTNDVSIFDVKVLSKEQPTELAPPGGGGGYGVRLHEISDVIPQSTMYIYGNKVHIYHSKDLSDIGNITVDNKVYFNQTLKGTYKEDENLATINKTKDLFRFTVKNNELIIIPNSYMTKDGSFRYKTGTSQTAVPQMGEIILQYVTEDEILLKIHKLDLDGTDRSTNIQNMLVSDKRVVLDSIETLINNKVRTEPMRLVGVGGTINNDLGDYYELSALTLSLVYDGIYKLDNDAINYTNNGQEIILKMANSIITDLDNNLTEKVVFDRFTKNINDLKTIVISDFNRRSVSVLKLDGIPYLRPIPNYPSANNLVIPIISEIFVGLDSFFSPNLNGQYDLSREYDIILSDAVWLDENLNNMEDKKKLFITPLDGIQRHSIAAKYANLGKGGKVLLNNRYLLNETDSTGKTVQIEFGDGGNGGFAQYFSATFGTEFRPDLSNTLPENVSNRIGVGGGGGAAVYLKQYDDKNRIGDPDVPSKGQDGADGGPGIVVIVADKYSF